jgi:arginyl-tRNA synthetase
MNIEHIDPFLRDLRDTALASLDVPAETAASIEFERPPEPEMGDRGLPCFQLAPVLKDSPPSIAEDVADAMRRALSERDETLIASIDAQGPYVNVSFEQGRLADIVVTQALEAEAFGAGSVEDPQEWMIEFSAPNTNKPQHLGHVRNDLIGESVATISEFGGHTVHRVNLVNDRGIHICKSMVAYQKTGDGETPASTGTKGDHFVGDYYVAFNDLLTQEYEQWQQTEEAEREFEAWLDEERQADRLPDDLGEQRPQLREAFFESFRDDYFNTYSDLGDEARQMLRRWEAGDEDVRRLWRTMNDWVLEGFDETYERLGVDFEKVYFESDTYEIGREVVQEGLAEGIFEKTDDGAVRFDLERVGMDGQKILLRSDGTTVYMTQDLGTALQRFEEYDLDRLIYVTGDEQDYHFKVLFEILTEIYPKLDGRLHHLSYGMVDLPEGKMKSREGTVVDADDLMDEMAELAEDAIRERYDDLDEGEIARRSEEIGLAALKYYMLDFNPRTNVKFDPKKSIDFQGRTGPYCLYGYARVQSIGRRLGGWPDIDGDRRTEALQALGTDREMEVVRQLGDWPSRIREAVDALDPSEVTGYLFDLVKSFSSLYNDPDHRIVDLEGPRRDGLILLSRAVADTIELGLELIGIETLEEM